MASKLLKRWWQSHFGSSELLQLILRQQDEIIGEEDQKRIRKWVDRDYLRQLAYHNFTILLKYKKRVADADKHGIREVLQEIKKVYPKPFGEINAGSTDFVLKAALTSTIDNAIVQMARMVVYSFKWLTVVILLLRFFLIMLAIIIVVLIVKS